jgi:hypothetical protein
MLGDRQGQVVIDGSGRVKDESEHG